MTSRKARDGEPTRYELTGHNTHLSVATDGAGEIVVTYRYKDRSRAYAGKNVQVLDTNLGRLMTVALDGRAEASRNTLTVLVPHVSVGADGEATVTAEAVRALASAGIEAGPSRSGMYQVVKLSGKARAETG
jgi:hypothetical protein